MKKLAITSFVAAAMALATGSAFADDGTITFNGALTANTCTINGNGTSAKDFTVTLPTVSTSALTAAGETAGTTAYNIALTACTGGSTASVFYQAGATVDPADGRLLVAAGGATNVKLELLNKDGTQIKAGYSSDLQNSAPADISTGAATLYYAVQYYATGTTGAGAANSSVVYSINYL